MARSQNLETSMTSTQVNQYESTTTRKTEQAQNRSCCQSTVDDCAARSRILATCGVPQCLAVLSRGEASCRHRVGVRTVPLAAERRPLSWSRCRRTGSQTRISTACRGVPACRRWGACTLASAASTSRAACLRPRHPSSCSYLTTTFALPTLLCGFPERSLAYTL